MLDQYSSDSVAKEAMPRNGAKTSNGGTSLMIRTHPCGSFSRSRQGPLDFDETTYGLYYGQAGRLVLGNTFNWPDLPAYALGVAIGAWIDRTIRRRQEFQLGRRE